VRTCLPEERVAPLDPWLSSISMIRLDILSSLPRPTWALTLAAAFGASGAALAPLQGAEDLVSTTLSMVSAGGEPGAEAAARMSAIREGLVAPW